MDDDADKQQKEKQNYLRKKILEKNLDSEKFVEFLEEKKGEEGADISNWTMDDLKSVVKEFYEMNNIPIEELEENDKKEEKEEKIDFIIDEDSLMNLFQKKTNKEKEKDKKLLFDFDKNFEKMNKIQKKQNKEKEKENKIYNKKEEEDNDTIPDDNKNDLKEKLDINMINENLTNIIDKEEHDEEYGIIMEDKVKCISMESTEFREHKDIRIEIKDPVKLEKKLFSGKSVNYTIITYPFND